MPLAWPAAAISCFASLSAAARIALIADPLEQFLLRRREIRERIDEPADLHRGDVLDDLDQGRPVEREMEGAPHPRIVERLFLAVDQVPWMTL